MNNDELSDAISALITVMDKSSSEQSPEFYADREKALMKYLKESQYAVDSGWPSKNDTSFYFVFHHLTGGN